MAYVVFVGTLSNDLSTELINGASWQLIETNGVLFAVLKRRALQKRDRPHPDKTSGKNFDTAMYPHAYKNLHGKPR
jgi:hypothetical protein